MMKLKMNSMLVLALLLIVLSCSAPAPQEELTQERSVSFSKQCLFVSSYQAAGVVDVDQDGNLDVVSGAYWFAGPEFVAHAFRANEGASDFLSSNSDLPYDVDGDGWVDVIVGAWGEEGIVWFKNPGADGLERGIPWESHQLTPTKGRIERTDLHDYDGDGVPEIQTFSYEKEEPAEVFRLAKAADGAPAVERFVLGAEGAGHGYAWGDVNGDGREDFLTEVGWYERPEGEPFVRSWELHTETALPHPSCPFAVKDLNQDGRLDIIFGRAHDFGLFWWEQEDPLPDGTTVWKKHLIDDSWSQGHVTALADLDGDGQEELVTGKCVYAHSGSDPGAEDPAVLYYYRWNASTSSFTRHTIAGPGENVGLGRQIVLADLNGDGRTDLVAPGKTGLWVLTNEGYQ
jgi:VCBS repeat protein